MLLNFYVFGFIQIECRRYLYIRQYTVCAHYTAVYIDLQTTAIIVVLDLDRLKFVFSYHSGSVSLPNNWGN